MEKQFAGREGKRPAGGVSILPEQKDDMQDLTVRLTPLMGATVVGMYEPVDSHHTRGFLCAQYTDLEESSEWMVSSLEDRPDAFKAAQGSGALKKSLDSPSTSVWGTSTGKGPKSGEC